jgi:5-methylcytosine-specific restriction enzyme B
METNMPKKLNDYLVEFKVIAPQWFEEKTVVRKHHDFFKEFFKRENLEKMKWQDFQKMGDHLHSMNALALAKRKAFGNPNHPIEQYREVFLHLVYGGGTQASRMKDVFEKEKYKLRNFGKSTWTEIFSYAFGDLVFNNARSAFAIPLLGMKMDRANDGNFVENFLAYNENLKPLIAAYSKVIGQVSDLPINLQVDQLFSYLYEKYYKTEIDTLSEMRPKNSQGAWIVGTGDNGDQWLTFLENSIIAIGWDELDSDFSKLKTEEEFRSMLQKTYNTNSSKMNDTLCCYEFAHKISVGDIIYAKQGTNTLFGKGIVESDYIFDSSRKSYQHIRRVRWLKTGKWDTTGKFNFPKKTLTEWTPWPDDVAGIERVLSGEWSKKSSENKRYWWLNANIKMWDPREFKVGTTQTYTTRNEKGNPRRIYKHFLQAKVGDLVIGYMTSPLSEISVVFEVSKEVFTEEGIERIEFRKIRDLTEPVKLERLREIPELVHAEPLINNQGSLFKLTELEFDVISSLISDENSNVETIVPKTKPYLVKDALEDLFIDEEYFEKILATLKKKKNIILQGPPGTGKTLLSKRIAYATIGSESEANFRMIQFHQSYSYEDFIQGYRPNEKGKFERKNGIFFEFCREAIRRSKETFVFVIDEINRGNLSKIFGELLMLIEPDKRGPKHAIPLTYSDGEKDEAFHVPENVHIIGMMNTADRSLSLVDYALRRRFAFFDLRPEIKSQKFKKHLKDKGASDEVIRKITDRISKLNDSIASDHKNLGPNFVIGHSFFCTTIPEQKLDDQWYDDVISYEIASLLKEYWYDDMERVDAEILRLKKGA